MKISEFLTQAKAQIDTPEKWTQHAFARDVEGFKTNYVQPDAVCFCTMGAARKVRQELFGSCEGYKFYNGAITELAVTLHKTDFLTDDEKERLGDEACWSIANFNDTSTHSRVMELFDVTIKRVQGEGQ